MSTSSRLVGSGSTTSMGVASSSTFIRLLLAESGGDGWPSILCATAPHKMRTVLALLLLLLGLAAWGLDPAAAAAAAAACEAKGFDSSNLLCGVCSKLGDMGNLKQECLGCCAGGKYTKAVLKLPHMLLMQSPSMQDFMSTRRQKFNPEQLSVDVSNDHRATQASLVLRGRGNEEQVLRVTKWAAGDLEDYLAQYFPIT